MSIDKEARIAIVGAGPAGLSAAWFLKKRGFHNVTVLEKLGRVGGLCKSLTIDGLSYDLGANYLTWAYRETVAIANEVGATRYREKPYTSIEVKEDEQGREQARYRPLKEAVLFNPITKEKVTLLAFIWAALKYFWLRLRLMPLIDRPDYLARIDKKTHPELCVNFRDWLLQRDLGALISLFEFPITIMGYGQLRHIAAPYALRYMSVRTFVPMIAHNIPWIGWIFEVVWPWPQRFTEGFQRMWQRVAWRTDVRLNVRISKIERPADPKEPIRITYKTLHQELNTLDEVDGTMDADVLILACPLTADVFKQLGLERTQGEIAMSDKIHFHPYCMTTYWVDDMQMPQPIAPILPLAPMGTPWAVARQFQHQGNHFTQFYTRTEDDSKKPSDKIEAEVKAEVHKLIELLGGTADLTRWHTYDRFTYFQHVEPDVIGEGYYRKLSELQGKDRTFYVGGVTDFELVEPIVKHSKYLVQKHFEER